MNTPCPRPSAKHAIGCSPCQCTSLCPTCPPPSATSEDKLNEEMEASSIGSSMSFSSRKLLWRKFVASLDDGTQSPQDPKQPVTMSGKKKQPFPRRNSSLGRYRSAVENQPIGSKFGTLPSPENWDLYQQTYMYVATINSAELARTTYAQWEWSATVQFSGAELVLESRETPGQQPVWRLILKIRTASSGTDTETMKMWSSMNFEEELRSTTYCDGLIDTRVSLKLKVPVWPFEHLVSGSPRI